jgi:hypothetical protein
MPCPECARLKEAQSWAYQVVLEAQTALDGNLETAPLTDYRRLRLSLLETKIGATLAEVEADMHQRECKATWGELRVRGSSA